MTRNAECTKQQIKDWRHNLKKKKRSENMRTPKVSSVYRKAHSGGDRKTLFPIYVKELHSMLKKNMYHYTVSKCFLK